MNTPIIKPQDLKTRTREALLNYINEMDLSKNVKLPREEQLSEIIGVSRVTLRSVLDELATEGVIFRKHGKGTFVNTTHLGIKANFNPVGHFSTLIRSSGYEPKVEILKVAVQDADEELQDSLQIGADEKVVLYQKMYFADGKPCAFCEDYVPLHIFNGKDPNELLTFPKPIFHYIFQLTGKKVTWDKVELLVSNREEKSELSYFEERPILLLRSVNYDDDEEPLVVAEEYVDTDILKFSMIRKRLINYFE